MTVMVSMGERFKPCVHAVAHQLITSISITIFNPSESASCAFTAITTRLWDLMQDMAHRDVLSWVIVHFLLPLSGEGL
ncbi:hypothetical protein BS47DRAFT_1350630, partial [Hydnum rufescens UP504]